MAGRQVPWPCAIQGGRHELGRDLCARMGTPSAVVPVAASGPGGAVGGGGRGHVDDGHADRGAGAQCRRSEEHTSELQSPCNLVCRLLLEKKNDSRNTLLTINVDRAATNPGE